MSNLFLLLLIDLYFRPKDNAAAAAPSSSSTSKDKERRSSRDGKGGSGRGRGRGGRRQAETIQTHSIFEQGPMERSNKGRKLRVMGEGGMPCLVGEGRGCERP